MRLKLEVWFYTDGDYNVKLSPDFVEKLKTSPFYEGAVQYIYNDTNNGTQWQRVELKCAGDPMGCRYAARDLLEQLAVSCHVSASHYYILPDLYNMITRPIAFRNPKIKDAWRGCLWFEDGPCLTFLDTIEGNYSGTEIELYIDWEEGDKRRDEK